MFTSRVDGVTVKEGPGGRARVDVKLEGGGRSRFAAAAFDAPSAWVKREGFSLGDPVLFVEAVEPARVEQAVAAMAEEMGGYWLRYYNSQRPARRAGRAAPPPAALLDAALARLEPDGGCGVLELRLSDGRQFSVLTATPAWFRQACAERGLPYYYGASVLFLDRLEPERARRAAAAMTKDDGRWLCLYDTPRTSLPEQLDRFRANHL